LARIDWGDLFCFDLYSAILGLEQLILIAGIATACGFVFHEMAHKFVAMHYGYVAHFKLWTTGLVILIVMAVITQGRFFFAAHGAVYIVPAAAGYYGYEWYSSTFKPSNQDKENMAISAFGPGTNLAFAAIFYILYAGGSNLFLIALGYFGLELNIFLGAFNMIPIPPLDGYKVFRKSIPVGLALALPLWIAALVFLRAT
jgi:Zn-dependent protease